jgi:hypothetical protein
VNLGERLVRSLFQRWADGRRALDAADAAARMHTESADPPPPVESEDQSGAPESTSEQDAQPPPQHSPQPGAGSDSGDATPSPQPPAPAAEPPGPYPDRTPVAVVDASGCCMLWRAAGALSGAEDALAVPAFVCDVLLHGRAPPPDAAKVQFVLLPAQGAPPSTSVLLFFFWVVSVPSREVVFC